MIVDTTNAIQPASEPMIADTKGVARIRMIVSTTSCVSADLAIPNITGMLSTKPALMPNSIALIDADCAFDNFICILPLTVA